MNTDRESDMNNTLMELPRGGYLVQTPAGNIQFGSPPETIKDTMKLPGGVPEIFILPEKMFNWIKGISIAEIEFPLYWNYFIQKKKTVIICREEQYIKIRKVIEESVFGPENFNIADDFSPSVDPSLIPDILSEMNYFRNSNKLSNMVQFGIFKNNKFSHKGITVTIEKDRDYRVYYYDYRGYMIWGLTARILTEFAQKILKD